MIETLMKIFQTMYNGFSKVAEILDVKFTMLGAEYSGMELLFGGAVITLLIYRIVKWILDIVT